VITKEGDEHVFSCEKKINEFHGGNGTPHGPEKIVVCLLFLIRLGEGRVRGSISQERGAVVHTKY